MASAIFPVRATNLKVNGFVAIKGRPCKITDISTAEDGGFKVVAIDIFTAKTYEDCYQSTDNVDVPHLRYIDYTLVDIAVDGHLSLMDDGGDVREDIQLPQDKDLVDEIKAKWEEGKGDFYLAVTCGMGEDQVTAIKAMIKQ